MSAAGRPGDLISSDELYEFFVKPAFDYRDTGLDLDAFPKQSFVFEVRGARNLFLALCQSKDIYLIDQMYEFLIGGVSCTKSMLRKGKNEGVELSKGMTYGIINEFSFSTFWVSWTNGQYRLGQGTVVGRNIILQYKDEKPFKPRYLSLSGWDVPVTVIIHKESSAPSDLLQVAVPNYLQYYDTGLRLDLSTNKYLLFEAKAAKNVYIGLTQYKDTYEIEKMYEVGIGVTENTKTILRRNKADWGPVLAESVTQGILDPNAYRPFWISWANNKVRFGRGNIVGEEVVVEYTDPNPIPIFHLAISGRDVFGNVIIHREPISVGDTIKDGVPNTFVYHDTGLQLSQSKSKSIVFDAIAPRNIFLALSLYKEVIEVDKVYEVLIGGWSNTSSTLRKNKFELLPLLAKALTPNILENNKVKTFWLSWADGIHFGTGSVVGQDTVLEFKDPKPLLVNWLSLAGWDVQGNVILHQPELTPPEFIQIAVPSRYEFQDVPGLNLSYRQSIVLDIVAKKNIFVALCSYRFTYEANRMYNFLIGGGSNTLCNLRKDNKDVGLELVNSQTPNILDEFAFVTFWLSWNNGRVRLGKGEVIGQNSLLEYRDPYPISINYLAVSGSDAPGTVVVRRGVYDIAFGDDYTYKDTGLVLSACTSIVFYLKASSDVCLALTSTKDDYSGKIYEFVFGAFGNKCTLIRVAKEDNMVASSSSPDVLNGDRFLPFWVSWESGNILAGRGAVVGEHILAAYDETDTPVAVNYIAITGYSESGVFRVE